MSLASAIAALKASLDAGNDQFTDKHFRLLIEALEGITNGDVLAGGFIRLGTPSVLTIASGTVTPTASFHAVDTEAAAASDDLDTISAAAEGDILFLRSVSAARVVTLLDGGGNLRLAGNFVMSDPRDLIGLLCFGSTWVEFTRSDNN